MNPHPLIILLNSYPRKREILIRKMLNLITFLAQIREKLRKNLSKKRLKMPDLRKLKLNLKSLQEYTLNL